MRRTYKLAFNREYDDKSRKQHPLPLEIAYQVALHKIQKRLEYIRGEIEAERISYEEIAELQSLAEFIEPGDTLLLEWAGLPEGTK